MNIRILRILSKIFPGADADEVHSWYVTAKVIFVLAILAALFIHFVPGRQQPQSVTFSGTCTIVGNDYTLTIQPTLPVGESNAQVQPK